MAQGEKFLTMSSEACWGAHLQCPQARLCLDVKNGDHMFRGSGKQAAGPWLEADLCGGALKVVEGGGEESRRGRVKEG